MSLDRRIYFATLLGALAIGSAVVAASPAEPLAEVAIVHEGTEPSTPVETVLDAPLHDVRGADLDGQRLVLLQGQGGTGVKAPSVWPVDLQREMSFAQPTNVGMVR